MQGIYCIVAQVKWIDGDSDLQRAYKGFRD